MEIDDELKSLWKSASATQPELDANQLREMLRGNSRGIIERMKKSVWFEIAITDLSLIVVALIIYYLKAGPLRWLMVGVFASLVASGVYFILKMRLLAQFDFGAHNLKDNLKQLSARLERFLRVYTAAFRWGYVIFYFLALIAIVTERGKEGSIEFVTSTFGISFLLFYTVLIAGSFMLVKWYVHKLYGVHLERLQQLLSDVSATE